MTIPGIDPANGASYSITVPNMQDVLKRVLTLETHLAALTERVATLEDAPVSSKERDDLTRKIMDFLRQYPGLKFTAPLVAENLSEPIPPMYTRLQALARQGLIVTEETDGRRGRLFHLPTEG